MSQGYTKVLDAIKKHQGEHLTVRRLCEITDISSTSTVHRYIKMLEDAGIIRRVQTYEVISSANITPIKSTAAKKQKQRKKVVPAKPEERIRQLREVMGFD